MLIYPMNSVIQPDDTINTLSQYGPGAFTIYTKKPVGMEGSQLYY